MRSPPLAGATPPEVPRCKVMGPVQRPAPVDVFPRYPSPVPPVTACAQRVGVKQQHPMASHLDFIWAQVAGSVKTSRAVGFAGSGAGAAILVAIAAQAPRFGGRLRGRHRGSGAIAAQAPRSEGNRGT